MKKFITYFMIFIFQASFLTAEGFWEKIDAPKEYLSMTIAKASNDNLFVGSYTMHRSEDEGQTWSGINNFHIDGHSFDASEYMIWAENVLAASNGYLFVHANIERVLYRSTDNGDNWYAMTDPTSFKLSEIAIDKNDKLFIYSDQVLYISEDYGETMIVEENWNANNYVDEIYVSPENTVFIESEKVLYSLKDSETEYKIAYDFTNKGDYILHLSFSENKYYLCTTDAWYSSENKGQTWMEHSILEDNLFYKIVEANDGSLYAYCEYEQVMKSIDLGQTWEIVQYFENKEIRGVQRVDGNLYFLGGGLYVTSDGETFQDLSQNFGNPLIASCFFDGKGHGIIGTISGLWNTFDNGDNWEKVYNESLNGDIEFYQLVNGEIVTFVEGKVIKSNDFFSSYTNLMPDIDVDELRVDTDGTIYLIIENMSFENELIRSEDGGENWENILTTDKFIKFEVQGHKIAYYYKDWETDEIVIQLSSDNGLNWDKISVNGLRGYDVELFKMFGDDLYISTEEGLYKYIKSGDFWLDITDGLDNMNFFGMIGNYYILKLIQTESDLFCNTQMNCYKYDGENKIWNSITPEDRAMATLNLVQGFDNHLYFSGLRGLYKSKDKFVSVIDQTKTELNFDIMIYPNPIRNKSLIQLNLFSGSELKISLYDLSGKKIMDIAEGHFVAGQQLFTLNSGEMTCGQYILSVTIEGKTDSRILNIVK